MHAYIGVKVRNFGNSVRTVRTGTPKFDALLVGLGLHRVGVAARRGSAGLADAGATATASLAAAAMPSPAPAKPVASGRLVALGGIVSAVLFGHPSELWQSGSGSRT
jgi:hypothetical protein